MLAIVLKSNRHLLGIRDDVIIGDDITGGIDHEPGTECNRLFLWISVRVLKKAPQELIERGSAGHGGHETASPWVSPSFCAFACSASSIEILTTAGSTCSASGAKLGKAIAALVCACCVRLRPDWSPFAGGGCAPENAGNRRSAAHSAPANVNRRR